MESLPKVIPPLSRVRLVRFDQHTPNWQKDVGRQFRIGYYSRNDGLDCIWLVNEKGEYEQTTNRALLLRYFSLERLSKGRNFYGGGKRRLGQIRPRNPLERLNGSRRLDAYRAADEICQRDDPATTRSLIRVLLKGRRTFNRAAAAYTLNFMHQKSAIGALEKVLSNKSEHPSVRGQAAESLAHTHRKSTHRLLRQNLSDTSRNLRFWCAYSLAEMADKEALVLLAKLAQSDHRVVKGFWSVSKEAKAAIRKIGKKVREHGGSRQWCPFCSNVSR
jgi:hypothetical protein